MVELPVVGHHAQDDLLQVSRRWVFADADELFVEGFLGDLAAVEIHHEAAVPAEESVHGTLLGLVPLAAHHDAVAVIERRRAGHEVAHDLRCKPAEPLKKVAHLRLLDGHLRGVINVLILAAAARAKMFATRLHAIGRRLQHLQRNAAREVLFALGDLHAHRLASDDERHENHAPIHAPHAFAAKGHVVDGQLERLPNLKRSCLALSQPSVCPS